MEAVETIERDEPVAPDETGLAELSVAYSEASFSVPHRKDPHEITTKAMAEIVTKIVQHEGPVHEDEIVARVRDLWGLERAGVRIQDSVAKAIHSVLVSRTCTREDGFLTIPGASVPIRNREKVSSSGLRKPDLLPPEEIRQSILALIDAHHGATRMEIPVAVARILGFKVTGSQLRSVIDAQLNRLQSDTIIEESGGMFKRVK